MFKGRNVNGAEGRNKTSRTLFRTASTSVSIFISHLGWNELSSETPQGGRSAPNTFKDIDRNTNCEGIQPKRDANTYFNTCYYCFQAS